MTIGTNTETMKDFEAWWYDYKIKNGVLGYADRYKAHLKAAWDAARQCGPKDGWIPVFKKLPEDGQSVLVYTAEGDFFQAYRNPDYHGGFERNGRFVVGVTHWHSVVPPPLATNDEAKEKG